MILKIAWRNIWRNKRRSIITIASVSFALFFAIIMRSMQLGTYDQAYASVINATTGYLQLQGKDFWEKQSLEQSLARNSELEEKLKSHPQVEGLVPRLESFALIASDQSETRPAFIRGVDFPSETQFFNLGEKLITGRFPKSGERGVLVAKKLAEKLGLQAGDTLVVIGQGYHGISANGKFQVLGLVDLKNPEANKSTVFMDLQVAQELTGSYERLTALIIAPATTKDLATLKSELLTGVDTAQYQMMTWREMMPELIQAMEADSAGGLAILYILYLVVGFGVFGTILMLTAERRKEFGILISVGMSRARLALSSFLEVAFLALLGVFSGSLLALPVAWYYHVNPIELSGDMDAMMEEYGMEPLLPFSLDPSIWLTNASVVFIISSLLALYVVVNIYRLEAVKAMRQ